MNVQHVLSSGCTNVINLYSYHVYRISFGTLIDERDPRRYPEDCKSRIPYTHVLQDGAEQYLLVLHIVEDVLKFTRFSLSLVPSL